MMKSTNRLLTVLLLALVLAGAMQAQPLAMNSTNDYRAQLDTSLSLVLAGFDSQNISVSLVSPTNRSGVSGTFNITLDIASDFGVLNTTLFIDGAIYPAYNETPLSTGTQNLTVDTVSFPEGNLNFTVFLEYKNDTWDERESSYLVYFVDNDGQNFEINLLSPANESTLVGTEGLQLNITSDFDNINFTLLIDGVAYPTYDFVLIAAQQQTINVDTTTLREGWLNFTLVFDYEVVNVQETHLHFLMFLIDNDGQPITLSLLSPTNQSEVSGVFNLTVEIASDYGLVNLTLFVDNVIQYSQYNETPFVYGVHDLTLNTTVLKEGLNNFTVLLEYNVTGENAKIAYYFEFIVNNFGAPNVVILSPDVDGQFTGVDMIELNITSAYSFVNLTISVDGVITPEYNSTTVPVGAGMYSINGSRYENGHHIVTATVKTAEGLENSASRQLFFLDHIRFYVRGITNFDEIAGNESINLRIETPYQNVTVSVYVDDVLVPGIVNVTVPAGDAILTLDTTPYSEGPHNVTFRAFSVGGHSWENLLILVVDNHGAPSVTLTSPLTEVIVGITTFTIEIESTWDTVNLTVFVDDVEVSTLSGLSVDVGEVTFEIDTNNYSKWEHTVRVLVTTEEGLTGETEAVFGFANMKIEEIVSIAIVLVIGIGLPVRQWRKGGSMRAVLFADLLFVAVVGGLYLVLGINSLAFALWHINLASIWAIGIAFIFTNWLVPLAVESQEE
ncbi:MAG: hypothetical protein ACE5H4_12510 [Candidatus Thorarchaeota archaeon]